MGSFALGMGREFFYITMGGGPMIFFGCTGIGVSGWQDLFSSSSLVVTLVVEFSCDWIFWLWCCQASIVIIYLFIYFGLELELGGWGDWLRLTLPLVFNK